MPVTFWEPEAGKLYLEEHEDVFHLVTQEQAKELFRMARDLTRAPTPDHKCLEEIRDYLLGLIAEEPGACG